MVSTTVQFFFPQAALTQEVALIQGDLSSLIAGLHAQSTDLTAVQTSAELMM